MSFRFIHGFVAAVGLAAVTPLAAQIPVSDDPSLKLTNERLAQLTAAGVAIEIADTRSASCAGAHPGLTSPPDRLAADFLRLPAYARRHSGGVSTEGDKIHHTDDVRRQPGVDGTSVRVGRPLGRAQGRFRRRV
jgi:hypothetical protein